VRFLAEAGATRPRVAFAVGRPVGSAVVRNRVRRRLRGALADLASDGRLPTGTYLVSVGPEAARAAYLDLNSMLIDAVRAATRPRPEADAR